MDRRIVLLRGVDVGGRNRLPTELRQALSSAGFAGVRNWATVEALLALVGS